MPDARLRAADAQPLIVITTGTSDQQPAAVYLARLSAGSRRTMHGALDSIAQRLVPGATAATLPWHQLRYQHTAALRVQLAAQYAPATANKMLSALRGVLQQARALNLMGADDCAAACQVASVKGETLPKGRMLAVGELAALLRTCSDDPSPAGARDAALLALLCGAGPRRSEVVKLELADYDQVAGILTIRSAKGNKDRTLPVVNGTQRALADWLAVRGDAAGPLFVRLNAHGQLTPHGLTDQAIFYILDERRKQAGVGDFSPHDLRRTVISNLLDAGADIATVQKIAGHTNVATTARYDRRGEEAKRKAAELLHVPYYGRTSR
jgi:site-specific recombinase XerD